MVEKKNLVLSPVATNMLCDDNHTHANLESWLLFQKAVQLLLFRKIYSGSSVQNKSGLRLPSYSEVLALKGKSEMWRMTPACLWHTTVPFAYWKLPKMQAEKVYIHNLITHHLQYEDLSELYYIDLCISVFPVMFPL